MRIDAAPLQGITTYIYRRAHAEIFGGVDRYFMPFLSPAAEHIITDRELRDILPDHNRGIDAVPQVMTRKAEDFLWAAGELAAMGYREINLNLGCPSGTVTAKGKGAGFLTDPAGLDAFFAEVFRAGMPAGTRLTVKTRLGMKDESEFPALLEIYNRYPIAELTIHPRIREDFYKRPVRRDAFAAALADCRLPVCYNGDIVTAADAAAIRERFPAVDAWMLGRGLIADPALARKIRGGRAADRAEVEKFTRRLYREYQEAYGGRGQAAQRMKELWFYMIHLFDDGEKYAKKMRRVSRPEEYEQLEVGIYRDLSLRKDAAGPL